MKENKLFRYPLILGIVAVVAGLLLAIVHNVTSPIIEKNANKRENAVILEVFGEDAKIENISDTLNEAETGYGVNNAYEVKSEGKTYYVYKLTIKDGVGSDDSAAIVALQNGKIYTLKFTSTGDSYANLYNSASYLNKIKGKTGLTDSDVVTGASDTGDNVIGAINAAIAHYGRVK